MAIQQRQVDVKSFDFDGVKYDRMDDGSGDERRRRFGDDGQAL